MKNGNGRKKGKSDFLSSTSFKKNSTPLDLRKLGNAQQPPKASASYKIDKPLSDVRVACVTPTHGRASFLRQAQKYFLSQDFPYPENLHWIIHDDSPEPIKGMDRAGGRIHYHYSRRKLPIGAKRNWLNRAAIKGRYDIVCSMDDDDWYSPSYVSSMVDLLLKSDAPAAGSSKMYMLDMASMKIFQFGPYFGPGRRNHTCNHLLCFKTAYAKHASYSETAEKAEERAFLDNWNTKILQHPDVRKVFLGIIHPHNTVPKERAGRRKATPWLVLNYGMPQRDVAFYLALRKNYKEQGVLKPLPPIQPHAPKIVTADGRAAYPTQTRKLRISKPQ